MNEIGKRVYVLGCNINNKPTIAGIYTNKKLLLEAMLSIGLKGCYIKAKRKNVDVNASSLQNNFIDNIIIYTKDIDGNETFKFKVLELKLNNYNKMINFS